MPAPRTHEGKPGQNLNSFSRRQPFFRRLLSDGLALGDELQAGEVRVEFARAQQFVVRADGVHAPAVKHDDAVGVAHGGKAVGDNERGAPAGKAFQRLRDLALALASSELVASSSSRIGRSASIARAIETRW